MGAPRRYLNDDELSIDQHVQRQQAEAAGRAKPKFERPEYVKARAKALAAAGFAEEAAEADADEADLETLTTAELDAHLRAGR